MNLQEMFGVTKVVPYNSKHGVDKEVPFPDQLVGIELEIEGFNPEAEQRFGGITFTTDGSLRSDNGGVGIEAITQPIAVKHVRSLLNAFYKKYNITSSNYSDRCSTHVHFNVQYLTGEQLTTICLLYQTLEKVLFDFVGHERDQNIYCVPWYQSGVSYNIAQKMLGGGDVFRLWQKYSALNLVPAQTQGTIEFRHLHGTCDVDLIVNWISILTKMFEYGANVPYSTVESNILNMNTVSNYHGWMDEVFEKYAGLLRTPGFEQAITMGVIDTKLMLNKTTSPAAGNRRMDFNAMVREMHEAPRADPAPRLRTTRPFRANPVNDLGMGDIIQAERARQAEVVRAEHIVQGYGITETRAWMNEATTTWGFPQLNAGDTLTIRTETE